MRAMQALASQGGGVLFRPPRLGVGIVYNAFLLDFIRRDPGLVDFVEVEPETLWAQLAPGQRAFRLVGNPLSESLTPASATARLPGSL